MSTDQQALAGEMQASFATLQSRLSKVEQELDLECSNLRDLVNSKDPEINKQLDSMSKSISELHESLAEVRGHLSDASDAGAATESSADVTKREQSINDSIDSDDDDEEELSAAEISRLRHDEKVTLSGVFRALFMADEPQQRANSKKPPHA